jgi:TPR repeat protein
MFSSSKGGLGQRKGVKRQTSTYRGVSWNKRVNKWVANIRSDGKKRHLGSFEDEEEAAKAYDKAARAHHGEKAQRFRMQLNFPTEKEQAAEEAAEEAKQQRWIKCVEARSTYRGVHWDKSNNKWVARIRYDGKRRTLGCFKDEEEAARAYDRAARAQHGEKSQLNFPAEGESGSRKSSKYRGVCWHKSSNKWKVQLYYDGKHHHLGCFEDEEEAAKAYDRAVITQHGSAATPNFEQPAKQHRGAGGTARTRAGHMTTLSSSSLPSTRKRAKAQAKIAKQSKPAKRSGITRARAVV